MCFSYINLVENKETIKDVTENKVLTNRSCSDEVHLQTLIVGISGKGLKGYVRALFDTGSQNTYISKYAARMLKLENLRTEKIKHGLFGGVEMSENHNRYRFNLSSLDNKFNCQIEALDQTKICSSLPMIKNEKFIKLLESRGIDISDVRQHGDHCLFEENPEEIHLLLGADTAALDSKLLSRRAKYRQRIRDNLRNRFRSEYLGQLRQHALKRDVLQKLCVGDVVLVEDINKRRLHWPLAKIIEIFPGRDNVVRLAKVKTDNGIFLRPIQRLFPLEISQSEDDPLPGGDLLHKQAFQRQSASPVAGPERPSQDAASASSYVTRTGRVIKPPQRLGL
ncbi:integrase catalytic domain-containing protein [Nephila pilipes]|uniref:Integrase catalytic domain-containing protein n=1 Tax=Nephila pilipes TaxID=299642 RepID=A0A8X6QIE7_NEPPI|nr:integrase catalytic domain-containing protein [Nephila pilipes]GFT30387.1 integrase catalytic domain-containing protein [Nephila pilipes]GFT42991.1 integrase catalytic domain-containing protein [Nephila pilipes]GFU15298.1 integrase catalytic domain-containing protein [Nephila pilipes]